MYRTNQSELDARYFPRSAYVHNDSNDVTDESGEISEWKQLKSMASIVGGTVDVTVHEVKHDGTLKEIHRASGGAWGGTKVDDSYMELLDELFDKETMKAFRQKFKIDHLELLRDFETKKRTIGSKPDDSSMTIKTSATLSEHIQDTNQCTLKEAVNRSNLREKVIIRRDRMTISGDIMEGIFSMSINSIIKHVQDVLNHPKVNRLDKILMVGGFSESPLIQAAVKKSFTDVMVMTPDDPGLAVLKGAVIYGHRPSAISSRVVQNTYGVAVTTDFNESIHPPENRFDQIYCRNVFSKFITIDENIDSNTVCSKTYSINDKSAPVCIDIMVSPLENPVVTTRDCTKLGTVLIKCPIGGWRSKAELIVELKFGGTEFSVRAVEKYTQVEQEATFDFLQ